jgi:hypothetical protein
MMKIHVAVATAAAVVVDADVANQTLMAQITKMQQKIAKSQTLIQRRKAQKVQHIAVAVAVVQLVKE